MRVNVDSSSLTDPRFKLLGKALGMTHFEARGRCLFVWNECYERASSLLSLDEVDALAEHDGFGRAMVHVGLASLRGERVHVKGIEQRIEWVKTRRRAAQEGGRKNRENWKQKKSHDLTDSHMASQKASLEESHVALLEESQPPKHADSPLALALALAPALALKNTEPSPPAQAPLALEPPKPEGPKPGTVLKAVWLPWYRARYGDDFAWFAKEGAQASRLMKLAGDRGAPEVLRRAEIAAAQEWRRAPVTLGALCEGWNGLSVEVVTKKLSPEERAEIERSRRVNGGGA